MKQEKVFSHGTGDSSLVLRGCAPRGVFLEQVTVRAMSHRRLHYVLI